MKTYLGPPVTAKSLDGPPSTSVVIPSSVDPPEHMAPMHWHGDQVPSSSHVWTPAPPSVYGHAIKAPGTQRGTSLPPQPVVSARAKNGARGSSFMSSVSLSTQPRLTPLLIVTGLVDRKRFGWQLAAVDPDDATCQGTARSSCEAPCSCWSCWGSAAVRRA